MKIIKKFYPNKEIFLIKKLNKKNVIKFYKKQHNKILFNEISGYKYFKKKNLFKLPKIISFNKKKRYLELEYIPGYKTSFFDIKKIFLKDDLVRKKITIQNYLGLICKNKKEENYLLVKNFFKIKKLLKKKIYISKTHGDFTRYNIIKYKNNFYVIDFEKFGERIFPFDIINWYSHSIFYKMSNYLVSNDIKISKNIFFTICMNTINNHIRNRIINFYKSKKILTSDNFKVYFILYLLEKIQIIRNDFTLVDNAQEKQKAKKFIFLLNAILRKFMVN